MATAGLRIFVGACHCRFATDIAQTGTHDVLEHEAGPYRELYELQSRQYR